MRLDQMEYLGELTPEQHEVALDAPFGTTYESIVMKADIREMQKDIFADMQPGGEQPEEAIHSLPGAQRGGIPLSGPDKEIK